MADPTDNYSKIANNRRCCVIVPVVGLFLLGITNITIVIYFGVVNKPISVVEKPIAVADNPDLQNDVGTTENPMRPTGSCQCHCPDAWIQFNGSCYLFSHEDKAFADSEVFCQKFQSSLVKIANSYENSFLKSHSADLKDKYRWIGLSDTAIEGVWKWTDGSTVEYTDWYPGQPGGQKIENCAILFAPHQYTWHDYACTNYRPANQTLKHVMDKQQLKYTVLKTKKPTPQ